MAGQERSGRGGRSRPHGGGTASGDRRAPAHATSAAHVSRPATKRAPSPPATTPSPRQRATTPRAQRRPVALPSVAPCVDLDTLRALAPDEARRHVNGYLYDVMPDEDACAFEAMNYRWELHLVDIEQVRMVRGVRLQEKKVRRYTAALRRGGGFPPLVGLGGEGKRATEDVLLCDGYHRARAMRRAGVYYAWVWLAVDVWRPAMVGSRVELATSAL